MVFICFKSDYLYICKKKQFSMHPKFLFLIIIFGFIIGLNAVNQNDIIFKNISVKDGLSQLSVIAIYQDSKGYMWFGTRDGLNRFNGYDFEVFQHDKSDSTSISDGYIRCISEDSNQNIWVGTTNGLNCFDRNTKTFRHYIINLKSNTADLNEIDCILPTSDKKIWIGKKDGLFLLDYSKEQTNLRKVLSIRVNSIIQNNEQLLLGTGISNLVFYSILSNKVSEIILNENGTSRKLSIKLITKDKSGNLWFGTSDQGFGLLDLKTKKILKYYSTSTTKGLSSNSIKAICLDHEGNLLIGTYNGLNIFNPKSETFKVYNQKGFGQGGLSNYAVEALCVDNAGGVWVGTYSGGINYFNYQGNSFRFYDTHLNKQVLGIIGPMQESNDGLWIGTEANGIIHYNTGDNSYQYFPCIKTSNPDVFPENNVKSLFAEDNKLYIGLFRGKLFEFDTNAKKYIKSYNIGSAIYSIKRDFNGILTFGTYSSHGLQKIQNGKISALDLPLKNDKKFNVAQITCLEYDKTGGVYIGTRSNGLYFYKNGQVLEYNSLSEKNKLSGNKISAIYIDKNQIVWIGTADGGLNAIRFKSNMAKIFTVKNGLKDNKVCSITEDKRGRIWVVTRKGISQVDFFKGVCKTFDYTNGINIQEFSQNSIIVTRDNTIYVGGDNGFISFNPDNIKPNKFIPPVVINNVKINNTPLKMDIDNNQVLNLKHNENNITITYSALSYINSGRNKYAYMLVGVDNTWNHINDIRTVNYANLSPGKYVFKVKGSNSDGKWNEVGTSMIINISSPFWWTWWAILFYMSILVFIAYFIIRYYRIKHDLEYQLALKGQQEELHQAKLNLFTYFSHELRTPLSLIIGPLEDILEKSTTPSFLNKQLTLMYQNAKRLLLLVNELMDFRKQETGQFVLRAAAGHFEKFTEEIILAFSELAAKKEIQLKLDIITESQPLWYDRGLFEKILLNLLSNAFKHTPNKGKIELKLEYISIDENLKKSALTHNSNVYLRAEKYLLITLRDSGEGIPENEIDNIFNPFYQIYNPNEQTESSSGIGLSLTKGLVDLHRGSIWAEFESNSGATFKMIIPYGNNHLESNEIIENYQDSENIKLYPEVLLEDQVDLTDVKSKKYTILVVEDNKELRTYIKSCLGNNRVLEASNGKEGVELAINHMPDMIISDIMMPEMNGLQLCKKLKEDIHTSHIPIILLTARVTMLQMKEGLELGADDYITKPFSSNILLLKIKNILLSRENLKNLYGKQFSLESMGVEVISADDRFMQKLYKVVEKHIDNPDLNIEKFCDEINMSSANLYRKIKAVTNLSPLEYVKSVRMQLAAKMLMETDLSITEVSEKVGFNSLIHFSSTFRKHFGFSPTKYVNNEKKHISDNPD
jgi:signal transduction histidine kinase/ligand-binding sensor domain-containing protein/DNA-binding response OmpR family regulator